MVLGAAIVVAVAVEISAADAWVVAASLAVATISVVPGEYWAITLRDGRTPPAGVRPYERSADPER